MKRITAKQYATSLYESIKDSEGEELNQRIQNFLDLVKKNKDLKILNNIFKTFVEVHQKEEGILNAEVTSGRELSSKVKTEIINWLKNQTNRTASLEEKIDQSILGGIIIKFEDTIVDASLKNNLKRLQKSLTQ